MQASDTGLLVERLGADGDGVATDPGTGDEIHIDGGLPGELYELDPSGPGIARRRIEASADRVEPPCRHAGRCGGCTLQHLSRPAALAWKQSRVEGALTAAGHDVAASARRPAFQSRPFARRRMDLAAIRGPAGLVFGLHVRRSRAEIVDLEECHVLSPSLFALVAPLRLLLATLPCATGDMSVSVNALADGIDLVLETGRAPGSSEIARLASFAQTSGIVRISWRRAGGSKRNPTEPIVTLATPGITFAGTRVTPPPATFLQATADTEAAIVREVLAGLPASLTRRSRIVELFAGVGTLSFPLATRARVDAYEGSATAFAALAAASGGTRVTAQRRDLAREPVSASELRGAAVAVLDPPHAGALAQTREIAAARVQVVILVSCNPATLGRDSTVLAGAGYRLRSTCTVDQFLWSARAESVSAFSLA